MFLDSPQKRQAVGPRSDLRSGKRHFTVSRQSPIIKHQSPLLAAGHQKDVHFIVSITKTDDAYWVDHTARAWLWRFRKTVNLARPSLASPTVARWELSRSQATAGLVPAEPCLKTRNGLTQEPSTFPISPPFGGEMGKVDKGSIGIQVWSSNITPRRQAPRWWPPGSATLGIFSRRQMTGSTK